MKKLFLILLLSPLFLKAQDSIMTQEQMRNAIIYMKDNFDKSHKEYAAGTALSIVGGLVFIGAALTTSGDTTTGAQVTWYIAGGISLIGAILMIDSHKYIGRAGRWGFEGNAVVYKL